ncbi:MAG: Tn3 family transposase, partial [Chloroflexota bacterium]|nr:Tn3 family transposase [Chloroflexota bacterium]
VVESWNAANGFIFYGRGGELATNRREDQEMGLLCLHLLQSSLVYINTLMIQRVLADEAWSERMTPRDLGALSPLLTQHINPYGRFERWPDPARNLARRVDIFAERLGYPRERIIAWAFTQAVLSAAWHVEDTGDDRWRPAIARAEVWATLL